MFAFDGQGDRVSRLFFLKVYAGGQLCGNAPLPSASLTPSPKGEGLRARLLRGHAVSLRVHTVWPYEVYP